MATFTKVKLSGGSDGRAIKIADTGSPGTLVHTTEISNSIVDEVWLYAYNASTSTVVLTVQFGGTTSVNDDIKIGVLGTNGLTLIIPGLVLSGDGVSAKDIRCYASAANVLTVNGYINRINQ